MQRPFHSSHRSGVTLIEVLVVIAIVAILAALLLPAVQSAREAARRLKCANNLKQMCLAIHNYDSAFAQLPQGVGSYGGFSVHVKLLPYMEQRSLYDSINMQVFVASGENITATQMVPGFLICPSDPERHIGHTNYGFNLGDGIPAFDHLGPFVGDAGLAAVTDGLSMTAAFSEYLIGLDPPAHPSRPRVIYVPNDVFDGPAMNFDRFSSRCRSLTRMHPNGVVRGMIWSVSNAEFTAYTHVLPPNQNSCVNTLASTDVASSYTPASLHPGGVNVGFLDGHVRFVRDAVHQPTWRALGSRAGGEVVSSDAY